MMASFEHVETFQVSPGQVFDIFRRPAERLQLAPPELHLSLIEGPAELQAGSVLTVRGRRWGVTQQMVNEITAFEDAALIVEEQRNGPFRSWKQTQRFESMSDGGVRITDAIEFEPPGGVLGRLATADVIRRELDRAFAFRGERLKEMLVASAIGEPGG